jgi:hypothetical protein
MRRVDEEALIGFNVALYRLDAPVRRLLSARDVSLFYFIGSDIDAETDALSISSESYKVVPFDIVELINSGDPIHEPVTFTHYGGGKKSTDIVPQYHTDNPRVDIDGSWHINAIKTHTTPLNRPFKMQFTPSASLSGDPLQEGIDDAMQEEYFSADSGKSNDIPPSVFMSGSYARPTIHKWPTPYKKASDSKANVPEPSTAPLQDPNSATDSTKTSTRPVSPSANPADSSQVATDSAKREKASSDASPSCMPAQQEDPTSTQDSKSIPEVPGKHSPGRKATDTTIAPTSVARSQRTAMPPSDADVSPASRAIPEAPEQSTAIPPTSSTNNNEDANDGNSRYQLRPRNLARAAGPSGLSVTEKAAIAAAQSTGSNGTWTGLTRTLRSMASAVSSAVREADSRPPAGSLSSRTDSNSVARFRKRRRDEDEGSEEDRTFWSRAKRPKRGGK